MVAAAHVVVMFPGTPVSTTPESTAPQLRAQPPMPARQSAGFVGPDAVPSRQVPRPEHQPQRVSATQVPQLPCVGQVLVQVPQSVGHVVQVSEPLQVPSPQRAAHVPQSVGHVVQVSEPLQVPSPQRGAHAPQSDGQLVQVSDPLHAPSPQRGVQAPQSVGQFVHVSLLLQVPSPQVGAQAPQSDAQLMQDSVPLQVPSPQRGGVPRSTVVTTSVPGGTSAPTTASLPVVPTSFGGSTVPSDPVPASLPPPVLKLPRALHANEPTTKITHHREP